MNMHDILKWPFATLETRGSLGRVASHSRLYERYYSRLSNLGRVVSRSRLWDRYFVQLAAILSLLRYTSDEEVQRAFRGLKLTIWVLFWG